jgi:hypothetical protein
MRKDLEAARQQIKTLEAASAKAGARRNAEGNHAMQVDGVEGGIEPAPSTNELGKRLADAQTAVAKWEGIPEASRDLFPDFEERRAGARAALEELSRERRAAKPWLWRLKGAEKTAARAEKATAKASEEVDAMLAQQMALAERLEAKRADLEEARTAHEGALATVASIRAEAAAQDNEPGQQGNAATADGSSLSGDVVKAVLGLVHQLNELPKAAAAGNLEDAIRAALGQAKLLLPLETGETATPTVGAAACAGHIGGAAARPPVPLPLRPRANRATSPAAVSCDSDSEEERRRSRSRERKEKEREKTVRDVVEGRQRTINDALVRGAA